MPITGFLVCSAKIVETTRSIVLREFTVLREVFLTHGSRGGSLHCVASTHHWRRTQRLFRRTWSALRFLQEVTPKIGRGHTRIYSVVTSQFPASSFGRVHNQVWV